MPHGKSVPPPRIKRIKSIEEDGMSVHEYSFTTHMGTHVDAPIHMVLNGDAIDDISLERFCGQGNYISLRKKSFEAITVSDLKSANVIKPDGVLIINTGWYEKFGADDYFEHPYLTEDSAEWLVYRRIKMLIMDTVTPDVPRLIRKPGYTAPVHRKLLGSNILIVENAANLGLLEHRRNFMVFAMPIKIADADGSPCRVFALINE